MWLKSKNLFILVGVVAILSSNCGIQQALNNRYGIVELKSLITGHFNSAAQAKSDSAFYDITLHMVPIWKNKDMTMGQFWLYVEQAIT